jgi:hypothetical protein
VSSAEIGDVVEVMAAVASRATCWPSTRRSRPPARGRRAGLSILFREDLLASLGIPRGSYA